MIELYRGVELLLVVTALLLSAGYAAKVLLPDALARARARLVLALLAGERPQWLRRIGRALAPAPRIVFTASSGRAPCGGCSTGKSAGSSCSS